MDFFNYKRRPTVDVHVGNIIMGGNYPVVVQTMTNTNTLDTEGSVAQCERIIAAGADLIRLTTQGVREANNLREIHQELRDKGYATPLSADIHFNPRAAEVAATIAEKVRINPGNFVDKQKTFAELIYTDEEYAQELEKIRSKVVPFLRICKEHGTAVRIGVNHGSLSDRIMSRYGDTPEGMVESCMEYLRIAIDENFTDIVISMKASNTLLMTKAVRLLVATMDKENIHFPLHLGVTEAGDGEDGRMKSAVGIGALLSDGLGDTIRVSLSEDPEVEVPVARKLVDYVNLRKGHASIEGKIYPGFSPYSTDRRETDPVWNIGGEHLPVVISDRSKIDDMSVNPHFIPDYIYIGSRMPVNFPKGMKSIVDYPYWEEKIDNFPLFTVDSLDKIRDCHAEVKFLRLSYPELSDEVMAFLKETPKIAVILTTAHQNGVGEQRAFFHALLNADCRVPVILQRNYAEDEAEDIQIKGGVDFGTVLLDGFGNGIMISNQGQIDITNLDAYAFGLLQAARVRTSKTEFISCPSCGRTLFDLQTTVALIKQHFSHLKHLKIGVMGCIVNGPGEMADADYGYVGAEHGKISLYRKKELIEKNIPQAEAVERLIQLIKDHGDWIEPEKN
ncbi:4-hydroxy-3-methylbut-2-en-1-yl diphosphate synthase [Proteiniphilum saccharofermentans]|uniref:4-hydroxy-3-methylbut-2-en-1-yl diphosphate synthase (flavodoxin) n=1 Tax=Proteiniphilum saccharofermentans TaxID=1642647 RepID=A0A1R3TC84_9BACT|nr:4-hydroxy-3-methylbut-2-en-1-yl diphosphate synthase [Proteiniphilum saccharofermentans]SCD22227.1 4-hydroxy-3-methylbut-2-en-1-yl diphosphate synthase [Proteiniphilum saccharofermentans]